MKLRLIGMALMASALATPAYAQFFVVQDTKTKKCTVVKEKPTTDAMVVVNEDGVTYVTETEAQAATKKIKVCTVD